MRTPMGQFLAQAAYGAYLRESAETIGKDLKKYLPESEIEKMRLLKQLPSEVFTATEGAAAMPFGQMMMKFAPGYQNSERHRLAKEIVKAQAQRIVEKMQKAGVTSALGFNFYDLRGPAYLEYPVNTPFRNSMGRVGRVNDGYGTAAHWQATRNVGSPYAGAGEGQRVQAGTPDDIPYIATYKEIGVERAVTFTAEFAGEGYTDNVADEHIRGLHSLWLQEESMLLLGNGGTASGNNGFQLGTANTPVATLLNVAGNIANATKVSFRVVEITGLGNPNNAQYGYTSAPSVTGAGLLGQYTRLNADGSSLVVNCGNGIVSAASNVVTTGSGSANQVSVSVTPKAGAFAWAWYVDLTDSSAPTKANAILTAITTVPTYTFNLAAAAGTQTAAATPVQTDFSAQSGGTSGGNPMANEFDGLLTYGATVGQFVNQLGASFTSGKDGSIVEVDADLQAIWQLTQAQPQAIYASVDAKIAFDKAVRSSGTNPSAYRFDYGRDAQNNLLGGYVVSAYQSKFSMDKNGGNALPVRIHPMLPPGTIYYDIEENPYPQSRIPFVRSLLVQRDYYGIEWPLVSRNWTFGTYAHEFLAHNLPWACALRTGIGAFTG